jgi:hypothetical protein
MAAHSCSKNGVASLAYVAGIHDLSLDRVKDVDGRNKSGDDGVKAGDQTTPRTWAQTATMARNKVTDASAKASSATARTNGVSPLRVERKGNIVHLLFSVKGGQWVSFNCGG